MINLISTTTSSSAAFPGGEAFEFSFSPQAQWCLAISSSRIIVLDTSSQDIHVTRELKVVRKPLSAFILSNGKRLAVLSTDHKVNIYDLSADLPKFVRSIPLDDPAHTITLTPGGEVLAVAYDSGIEVYSLADNALPTDKRAVKCDRVDHLSFSTDGTILLGTTQHSRNPNTVILSAPYFTDSADQDLPYSELISHMWTSQILFPNSSRDSSHATLLPRKIDHDANWTLTYDRVFESFRAVRTDDLRNGTTYFTGPTGPKPKKERQRAKSTLVPCTLPSITPKGELVAAGFLGSEVWLYGAPEDLDNPGVVTDEATQTATNSAASSPVGTSSSQGFRRARAEFENLPRWQVLVDKYRNVFAKGKRITKVSGVSQLCWSRQPAPEEGPYYIRERLIIAAPGGVSSGLDLEADEMASYLDGGRLVVLDFDWVPEGHKTDEITIEVGLDKPQLLEEENTDMATEIAIVRRRTVARRDGIPRTNVASVVDVLRPSGDVPPVPPIPTSVGFGLDATVDEEPPPDPTSPTSSTGVTLEEAAEAFDGPYSHTNPRSRNTLYRSATAVEASRRRNPPRIPESGRVEYRRTDGTELPHESDADNWVPPPPPYTKEADHPLPSQLPPHLRGMVPSPRQSSIPTPGIIPRRPLPSHSAEGAAYRRRSHADVDSLSRSSSQISGSHQRRVSHDTSSPIQETDIISPVSQPSISDNTSSRNSSPVASTRRPMSSYEPRRASLYRAALRPASPFTAEEEDSVADTYTTPRPRRAITHVSRSSSLSITGANLQQRLDYPLPPPPSEEPTRPNTPPSPIQPSVSTQQSSTPSQRPSIASHNILPPRLSSLPPVNPTLVSPPISPPEPTPPVQAPQPRSVLEPSAWALNNMDNRMNMNSPIPFYGPPINTRPISEAAGSSANRSSRIRSAFRRNASHSHLRVSSAFDVSPTSPSSHQHPQRLDTIYSLNAVNTAPASRPESRATDQRSGSRLGRRFSRFGRSQSEDPAQLYHSNTELGETAWVGRGRRRGRQANTEIWEEVVPEEEPRPNRVDARTTRDREERRGHKSVPSRKCIIM